MSNSSSSAAAAGAGGAVIEPRFGQVVIGPPGSGKTTYCKGLSQYCAAIGRPVAIVNLDPANDALPYDVAVDIADLIQLDEVMEQMGLGPNGGLIYCLEHLEKNSDWLVQKIAALGAETYLLFDFPGQVELFTHHGSVHAVLDTLKKHFDVRLTAVSLVDAHHCSDPAKFISVVLVCLSAMLLLELPHVNVLSKVDLIEQYGELAYNLDFYTEASELDRLVQFVDSHRGADQGSAAGEPLAQAGAGVSSEGGGPGAAGGGSAFHRKFRRLNKMLCEVIQDFGLVGFTTLNIQDSDSVRDLLKLIDKSNGFFMPSQEGGGGSGSVYAIDALGFEAVRSVEQKHMSTFESDLDDLQREMRECAGDGDGGGDGEGEGVHGNGAEAAKLA